MQDPASAAQYAEQEAASGVSSGLSEDVLQNTGVNGNMSQEYMRSEGQYSSDTAAQQTGYPQQGLNYGYFLQLGGGNTQLVAEQNQQEWPEHLKANSTQQPNGPGPSQQSLATFSQFQPNVLDVSQFSTQPVQQGAYYPAYPAQNNQERSRFPQGVSAHQATYPMQQPASMFRPQPQPYLLNQYAHVFPTPFTTDFAKAKGGEQKQQQAPQQQQAMPQQQQPQLSLNERSQMMMNQSMLSQAAYNQAALADRQYQVQMGGFEQQQLQQQASASQVGVAGLGFVQGTAEGGEAAIQKEGMVGAVEEQEEELNEERKPLSYADALLGPHRGPRVARPAQPQAFVQPGRRERVAVKQILNNPNRPPPRGAARGMTLMDAAGGMPELRGAQQGRMRKDIPFGMAPRVPMTLLSNVPAPQKTQDLAVTISRLKLEHINPPDFDIRPANARYFIIKSYSADDVHKAIKYSVWASTPHGNKRLDAAFRESSSEGPVYLLYSVNGSGCFCGMAQMLSCVDHSAQFGGWAQKGKWTGQFQLKWIFIKNIPNRELRHIRLTNNKNKPVTNSRDTQEVLAEPAEKILKIFLTYPHKTSILDDFEFFDREERKVQDEDVPRGPPAGRSRGRRRGRGGGQQDGAGRRGDRRRRGGGQGRRQGEGREVPVEAVAEPEVGVVALNSGNVQEATLPQEPPLTSEAGMPVS